ncbi:hypothetical protein [Mycobacteroides abscessus]|uniref:hypothetical protein n=1 Tax=Mycobacteroides abscessus TaxID=36809 RepID=UPI0013FD0A0C|nr:hypothetical protein [Mycobacteroides abscessus]
MSESRSRRRALTEAQHDVRTSGIARFVACYRFIECQSMSRRVPCWFGQRGRHLELA